ncbi:uncharacterized protein LOC111262618 isoform X1 [Varroa jacobsoni]|uniref:uncharacterized protein LOC111262618 isoform X1 n=1 Tax=Varroa jacobsoni TaxID=62625 RepID=UPI000BF31819|nr:uncharacterized protein LOC111262618 isoform X1 [Varroa jacobsoni]XP_022692743.1 uncharacterized protein LOC111262618 isoform X1 [Varroa jacobsoni]
MGRPDEVVCDNSVKWRLSSDRSFGLPKSNGSPIVITSSTTTRTPVSVRLPLAANDSRNQDESLMSMNCLTGAGAIGGSVCDNFTPDRFVARLAWPVYDRPTASAQSRPLGPVRALGSGTHVNRRRCLQRLNLSTKAHVNNSTIVTSPTTNQQQHNDIAHRVGGSATTIIAVFKKRCSSDHDESRLRLRQRQFEANEASWRTGGWRELQQAGQEGHKDKDVEEFQEEKIEKVQLQQPLQTYFDQLTAEEKRVELLSRLRAGTTLADEVGQQKSPDEVSGLRSDLRCGSLRPDSAAITAGARRNDSSCSPNENIDPTGSTWKKIDGTRREAAVNAGHQIIGRGPNCQLSPSLQFTMSRKRSWRLPSLLLLPLLVMLSTYDLPGAEGAPKKHSHEKIKYISFTDPTTERFIHQTMYDHTGNIYVGAVNKIYQLDENLELQSVAQMGPQGDDPWCPVTRQCPTIQKKPLDYYNKVLVIDYVNSRLISCGSLFQGVCSVHRLDNVADFRSPAHESVVANNATASTVGFIGKGPNNQRVLYVGVSYTNNGPYRSDVPAVSSRSLDLNNNTFNIAVTGVSTGTRVSVNSLAREFFPIHYVFGFTSKDFSYLLTVQKKETDRPYPYISKLVRVCQRDVHYYSYTEVALVCRTPEGTDYNLAQAAYVGKPGSELAVSLGISAQDDVLFVVFAKSADESDDSHNKPTRKSALCVYALSAVHRKFTQNIHHCFNGHGQRGLDFINPSQPCQLTIEYKQRVKRPWRLSDAVEWRTIRQKEKLNIQARRFETTIRCSDLLMVTSNQKWEASNHGDATLMVVPYEDSH